jgi:hypothetical protein
MAEEEIRKWDRNPPATSISMIKLVSRSINGWPKAYLRLLHYTNGGEGALAVEPGWFQLWTAEEAYQLNQQYPLSEFCPGYWAFGSSGGGELFLFKDVESWNSRVYRVPCIGLSPEEVQVVCNRMEEFIEMLGLHLGDTDV